MSDLADFLLARIAEDEAALDYEDGQSLGLHIITVQAADRWLAECDARRRIVAIHGCHEGEDFDDCAMCCDGYPCATLRLLALPYADHPDYRDEWRP